jgi:hypothetical protein
MIRARARRRFCASALAVTAVACFGCAQQARSPAAESWVTLLDASKLEQWRRVGDANWRVVDGVVQADRGAGYLVSADSYRDVQVRAEFWVDEDANSGVFLRCQDLKNITPFNSYEVNIWDRTPNPGFGTGSIVTLAKVAPALKAAGRWNTFDISARGPHIRVVLNGVQTVELEDAKHPSGPIAIQYAGGVVRFKRLEVRPL